MSDVKHSHLPRYVVIDANDFKQLHPQIALENGYDPREDWWGQSVLLRREDDDSFSYLGNDSAEPEDKIFVRDGYDWLIDELNTVAAKHDALVEENRKLRDLLQRVGKAIRPSAVDHTPSGDKLYRIRDEIKAALATPSTTEGGQNV